MFKGFITNYFSRHLARTSHINDSRRRRIDAGQAPVAKHLNRASPWLATLGVALMLGAAGTAKAADAEPDAITLTIKAHRFEPVELTVPANTKVRLLVKNADPTPEEFESYELNREKVVPGNSELMLFIGPLAPGTYPFFGDFNQDTAQGRIIAK